MVDLASKNLLHDRLRLIITLSGVAFSVALVLVQVGLFAGLLANATITIDKLPADLWVTGKGVRDVDFSVKFPEAYVHRARAVPGVLRADNLFVGFADVRMASGTFEACQFYALEDFKAWSFPWNIEEGDVEDLRRGPFFFIDESADRRYKTHIGIGEYRELVGHRMQVIGRTREAKSFTTNPLVFMDYERAQELLPPYKGQTSFIIIKVAPGYSIAAVQRELRGLLPQNEVLTSEEWAARSRSFWITNTGLGFNIFVTVFLGCLVAIVIVAQTLYTSTLEHVREYGMLKAMGGSNADIYAILGKQAVIAALAGYALGLAPSLLAREALAHAGLRVLLPLPLLGAVLVGTVVLCLLAAMVSFRRVASIDPALVFRA